MKKNYFLINIQISMLCVFLFLVSISYAQTGPGGIGDVTSNVLWLKSEDISLLDAASVSAWADDSGNGNDLEQPDNSFAPHFKTDILNGYPVVRFDGTLERIRKTSFDDFPTSAITAIYVNKTTAADSNDGVLSYAVSSNNNEYLLFNSDNLRIYRGSNNIASGVSANDNNWHIMSSSWQSSDGAAELWKDGVNSFSGTVTSGSNITSGGSFAIAGEQDAVDDSYDSAQSHQGDFAEVILFNTFLNEAQHTIVANYLAAKYNLTISNDFYSYQAIHSYDVAGVGREDASNIHASAMSAGMLGIQGATDLNDAEYLFFGHDGLDNVTWSDSDVPNSDVKRLAREWRLDETGDVGTVNFSLDNLPALPALPSGWSNMMYALMVDSDGDFTDGATVYELALDGGSGEYTASSVEISDGDFVSIAIINPIIEHTLVASSGTESITTIDIEVNLNFIPEEDKTIEITTADDSAKASSDYTSKTNETFTVSAGETSGEYEITVIDDAAPEGSESFTITLSNPIAGIGIGDNNVYTYTIADNDGERDIDFTTAASSFSEGSGTVSVSITLSESVATPTSVNYSVIGGTAVSGTDYTAFSGTATIAASATTTTFDVTLTDDSLFEIDETIIIALDSPDNFANLIGDIEHTLTITDNDIAPSLGFTSSSSSNSESVTSVDFVVELSEAAGTDITVNYAISGTATSGVDFTLDAGVVTFLAGESSKTVSASIVDDAVLEDDETIIITLSGEVPNEVTLGTSQHTYTIVNDDVPLVEFSISSDFGLESVSSVDVDLELSDSYSSTSSVDYTVTGTATGGGVDYTLADGTVDFLSGDTDKSITIASIIDDSLLESNETVIITLSNPVNALLGSNTVYTYSIIDNGDITYGNSGPGGVGDDQTNVLWLDANELSSLADGDDVDSWVDVSGNGNGLSEAGVAASGDTTVPDAPVYVEDELNGNPVVRFDVANGNQRLIKENFTDFPTNGITSIMVNKSNDSNDGILSYADPSASGDNDFLNYNSASLQIFVDNTSITPGVDIQDANWHIVNSSWRSDSGAVSVWLDGNESYSQTGVLKTGGSITSGGVFALAAEQDDPNGGYAPEQSHQGDFSEVIVYNGFLNDAQQIIVSNYLSAKYGIAISNDFYTQDDNGDFDFNVAGIGMASDNSSHEDSRGSGLVRVYAPSSLAAGDYLFWGRDTNDDYEFLDADFNSTWRVSEPGDVGTVTVEIDFSGVELSGVSEGFLLVVDNDSDLLSPTNSYSLTHIGGGIYQNTGVAFTDGDYFSVKNDNLLSNENINKASSRMIIYQDSSSDNLVISNKSELTILGVSLYNVVGVKVAQLSMSDSDANDEFQIALDNVSSAVYIVKIETDKGSFSKKVIIK